MIEVNKKSYYLLVKYTGIVVTTAIMSLVLSLVNSGGHFNLNIWLRAWFFAFLSIVILNMFIPKLTKKFIDYFFAIKK